MEIAVVIPAYNREREIQRALQSVLSQGEAVVDVIVVDDGSTDRTSDVVRANARRDPRVQLVSISNGGVSKARNIGLRRVRAEWVAFLDSDDEWYEGRIEAISQIIQERPEVDFIHGDRILINQNLEERVESRREFSGASGEDLEFLLTHMVIKTSTALIRTDLLHRLKPWFRENLKTCEDFEFFWRLVIAARSVAYDETGKVCIHITPNSLTDFTDQRDRLRDHVRARQSVLQWMQTENHSIRLSRIFERKLFDEAKALLGYACRQGPASCLNECLWLLRNVTARWVVRDVFRRIRRRCISSGATGRGAP